MLSLKENKMLSLVYTVSSKPARAIKQDCLKNQGDKRKRKRQGGKGGMDGCVQMN